MSDSMTLSDKTAFCAAILSNVQKKSLILVNNTEKCQNWTNILNKYLKSNHVYSIPSGMNPIGRKEIFAKFQLDSKGGY